MSGGYHVSLFVRHHFVRGFWIFGAENRGHSATNPTWGSAYAANWGCATALLRLVGITAAWGRQNRASREGEFGPPLQGILHVLRLAGLGGWVGDQGGAG